ncbi:MAG: RNA polymerase sigma factor [Hyphomicrobiaceae bacterium]|nr:RNA polymerase sigma factor [Hyphomicrobiaceae bacterium]
MGSKSAVGGSACGVETNSLANAYSENRDALKRYFVSRLRCPDTAEDLTQETWIKANDTAKSLITIKNPRAYLFSMAANLATDYLRTRSRQKRLLSDGQNYLWNDVDKLTPERYVIARDELDHMGGSLAELRAISRKIFYLNRIEGCTNRQIADRLGISTGAVAYHIKLVLDHLARARDAYRAE